MGRRLPLPAAALLILAAAAHASDDRMAEKPDAVVFLSDLGRGPAAPSEAGLRDVVVLSEVAETDPWFAAVRALGRTDVKEVVPFRAGRLDGAFRRLGELRPGFVVVLVRPSTLDVNFHFEFLERASRLDDDPFVDFAFGYLTGATPEEAASFAAGIAAARGAALPRTILDFGPVSTPSPLTGGTPISWARIFTERSLLHGENDPAVAAALAAVPGIGIYRASGHGSPDRVAEGLTGAQIRAAGLDLSRALYFSGPCWCGVTGRWFDGSSGGIRARTVAPGESFLLALLKARIGGVFAGLDPDRGETSHHEVEHLLTTGDPLGLVAKSTWDDAVLAYRRRRLDLPRYEDGKGSPLRDIHEVMISGGACRALFGDPAWAPFEAAGPGFFGVEREATKQGLLVRWRCDGNLQDRWAPVDVFRAGGGWTHRIRFRFDLTREEAAGLRRFEVVAVTKDGRDLPFSYPTAALEAWGDRVRVHGYLLLPQGKEGAPLFGGRELEARFLFRR